MWETLVGLAERLWDAYLTWVTPLFPILQWGVAIGGLMVILGWGVKKIARQMMDCPNCGRVIPQSWNPCRMCGHVRDRADSSAPGPVKTGK
jgi:hypothetical protein